MDINHFILIASATLVGLILVIIGASCSWFGLYGLGFVVSGVAIGIGIAYLWFRRQGAHA